MWMGDADWWNRVIDCTETVENRGSYGSGGAGGLSGDHDCGTILPFLLYLAAVKYAGSVYAGLLSSVEPVAATIVAAVFLGTSFPAIDILGFALVLSTLFILNINAK